MTSARIKSKPAYVKLLLPWLCGLLALLALVRRGLRLLPVDVDRPVGGALLVHAPLRLVAPVVLLVVAHRVLLRGSEARFARAEARLPFSPWSRSSTRGAARSGACACLSRTSATSAARIACPRRGSSGCRSGRS